MDFGVIVILILTIRHGFRSIFHPNTIRHVFWSNLHSDTIHYDFWSNFYPNIYGFWSYFHPNTIHFDFFCLIFILILYTMDFSVIFT